MVDLRQEENEILYRRRALEHGMMAHVAVVPPPADVLARILLAPVDRAPAVEPPAAPVNPEPSPVQPPVDLAPESSPHGSDVTPAPEPTRRKRRPDREGGAPDTQPSES